MSKKKKLIILSFILLSLIFSGCLIYFIIKFPDTYTNIFGYIFAFNGLISAATIGAIAYIQTDRQNKEQIKTNENRLKNIKLIVEETIKVNKTIINSWKLETETIFELCILKKGNILMSPLKNWDFSIFSAIDLDYSTFEKLEVYNTKISLINHHINNFNTALKTNNQQELIAYKDLIIKEIKDLGNLNV